MMALAVNWQDSTGTFHKGYLIADANQMTFGVRLEPERFSEIKTTGAVVALVRKYAPTGGLPGIYWEPATSDYWIPLLTKGTAAPEYWLQIAHGAPPELRFIDASGQVIVRKSSQGSFTKKTPLGRPLPSWPTDDQLSNYTESLKGTPVAAPDLPASTASAPEVILPDYQRSARDRLARRLKTVTKSLQKSRDRAHTLALTGAKDRHAQLLKTYLYRVNYGDEALHLEPEESGTDQAIVIALDPSLSPGQNLAHLFDEARKTARGNATLKEQISKTEGELAQLTCDLAALRAGPLSLDSVNAKLKRHGLAASSGGGVSPAAADATPYRTFVWSPDNATDSSKVRILVGKSAADSDELCRLAKSNDYWFHAVGTTGSHVIIPARDVRGELPAALLKCASILAIYYSKLRGDMAGEVYLSRRQHIKKRSGMAPGLWQIVKAETSFYRYDERELQDTLNRAL